MDPHHDFDLDALVKGRATRYEAPAELRERINLALHRVDAVPTASQSESHRRASRQWFNVGVAFACGLLMSVAVTRLYSVADEQDRLAQEVVSGHVRSLMVAHLADVVSTDRHAVKPWFAGKLDFAPPVYDLRSEGFPLMGGRLDYLEQRPVAALIYRRRQHTINLFIWPSDGDLSRDIKLLSRQGFNLASWRDSGMQFWAVSDVELDELQAFGRMLRKQGHHPSPG